MPFYKRYDPRIDHNIYLNYKTSMQCKWEEDPLICGLMDSKGKKVEIVAFGIVYTGLLKEIDLENGFVVLADSEHQTALEIERIESFSPLS